MKKINKRNLGTHKRHFIGLSLMDVLCVVMCAVAPDGVLEAVVGRPGEHQVGSSQLLDVAQPLELRRVYEAQQQRMQLDVSVDGVVEHLCTHTHTHTHISSAAAHKHTQTHTSSAAAHTHTHTASRTFMDSSETCQSF